MQPLYFDSASTTPCSLEVLELFNRYSSELYGNPSSIHSLGIQSAKAIREARDFFAQLFQVERDQVIFTGSGTEANNLAIHGVAFPAYFKAKSEGNTIRIVTSAIEHPSVKNTVSALNAFGIETQFCTIDIHGIINSELWDTQLTSHTALFSVQKVNNITGTIIPVEDIAMEAKKRFPNLIIHSDCIQAFGKLSLPNSSSKLDLISLSGHKINGPKGVGALIVLNRNLLKKGDLRPVIWGGEQEGGLRSGTQNAGLIAGFHLAAKRALESQNERFQHCHSLSHHLKELLQEKGLLNTQVIWNSSEQAIPHIISLGIPGIPSGALARLLEERGCLVSVGSACSSRKPEPDPVLKTMGFPQSILTSSIRLSFSTEIQLNHIHSLVEALTDSIRLARILGARGR